MGVQQNSKDETKDLTWSYPKLQGLHYIAKGSSYMKHTVVWGHQSEPTAQGRGQAYETR